MYVLRYRMPTEVLYQYIIATSSDTQVPDGAIESFLFGPFASKQEAREFIEQQID